MILPRHPDAPCQIVAAFPRVLLFFLKNKRNDDRQASPDLLGGHHSSFLTCWHGKRDLQVIELSLNGALDLQRLRSACNDQKENEGYHRTKNAAGIALIARRMGVVSSSIVHMEGMFHYRVLDLANV
jgi:hypothetical protein